jgi:rubrerythrin
MAKKTVWASVRFGLAPELIKYIDTGITRSLFDRIAFVENTHVNKIVSAMISQRYAASMKGKPSPESALSMFYEMEESYKAIAEIRKSIRYLGTAIVALAFADYHSRHGDEAAEMYSELFKLTTKCQPAQALRNFLTTSKQRGSVQYPYIVSACLANHEGREVKVLRASNWR